MNTITISHEAIVQNVIDEYLALLKKHQGGLYKDFAMSLFQDALMTVALETESVHGDEAWTPEIVNESNRRACQIDIFHPHFAIKGSN